MKITPRPIIGVIGTKRFNQDFPYETIAEQIGQEIARRDYWLLCGGTTGVMEAAPRGAKQLGGLTIGILPRAIGVIDDANRDREWPSSFIDIAIFTGLGGRIAGRNRVIVDSCDAIIALPGSNEREAGTRSEIELARQRPVPLILHRYWQRVSNPGPIAESVPMVQYYDSATEAVEKAIKVIEEGARAGKLTSIRR